LAVGVFNPSCGSFFRLLGHAQITAIAGSGSTCRWKKINDIFGGEP
jgi:hypothetical protein